MRSTLRAAVISATLVSVLVSCHRRHTALRGPDAGPLAAEQAAQRAFRSELGIAADTALHIERRFSGDFPEFIFFSVQVPDLWIDVPSETVNAVFAFDTLHIVRGVDDMPALWRALQLNTRPREEHGDLCLRLVRLVGIVSDDAVDATFYPAPRDLLRGRSAEGIVDSVSAWAANRERHAVFVYWSPRLELIWQFGKAGVVECSSVGMGDISVRLDTINANVE